MLLNPQFEKKLRFSGTFTVDGPFVATATDIPAVSMAARNCEGDEKPPPASGSIQLDLPMY